MTIEETGPSSPHSCISSADRFHFTLFTITILAHICIHSRSDFENLRWIDKQIEKQTFLFFVQKMEEFKNPCRLFVYNIEIAYINACFDVTFFRKGNGLRKKNEETNMAINFFSKAERPDSEIAK